MPTGECCIAACAHSVQATHGEAEFKNRDGSHCDTLEEKVTSSGAEAV